VCQTGDHGHQHGPEQHDCGCGDAQQQGCGCGDAHGGATRGHHEPMLQPLLLLLLSEKSAHGYELNEKLANFGLELSVEPTTVYRYLRRFEELGLVTSQWETQDAGPARRLYEITDEGRSSLRSFAAVLRKRRDQLDFVITRIDDVIDEIR
jgi:PadR family transcriptional regulator PadR